jgi:hypothetical protein
VIDFLKKYEFKSLIPAEYREAQKVLPKSEVIEISTLEMLEALEKSIIHAGRVIMTTDEEGSVVLRAE